MNVTDVRPPETHASIDWRPDEGSSRQRERDPIAAAFAEACRVRLRSAAGRAWSLTRNGCERDDLEQRLTAVPFPTSASWLRLINVGAESLRLRAIRAQPTSLALELMAVDSLNQAIEMLEAEGALIYDPLLLTRLAFYTTSNPISLCPQAFAISDLLSVSAWCGLSQRHERIVMPAFVASYWQMLLEDAEDWPEASWGPDAFLIDHAKRTWSLSNLCEAMRGVRDHRQVVLRRRA